MIRMKRARVWGMALALCAHAACWGGQGVAATDAGPRRYFRVRVVDRDTGRGVPMVELETVNHILYITDSAGLIAIDEPGLVSQPTYFHIRSHGYAYPKDGFGNVGVRLDLEPGGSARVEVQRVNVAERLYRVTGQGIYRDSLLLGEPVPLRRPVLNGGVLGQDSVLNAVYRGKLYWFWGDTNRAGYPLGHYKTSGATSALPGSGGLPPGVGVDLDYFVDPAGFSRPVCPIEGPGPVWISGVMVFDEDGTQRMACHYSRMKDLGTRLEQGIAIWNDEAQSFEKAAQWPLETTLGAEGHAVRVRADGEDWFYFAGPYPVVRVRAIRGDILDPTKYEAYTCYAPGGDEKTATVERDAEGRAVWGWKANTAPPRMPRGVFGLPSPEGPGPEGIYHLTDVETGKAIRGHGGSVYWNAHRGKWVMIALETMGRSVLGEVWYAEGDTILGPWVYARRIVTHEKYCFYNVKQHPYFDEDGGRRVYFEGTYTDFIAGAPRKTPWYDYNQIMYRLDLDDDRLRLPAPVYETAEGRYVMSPEAPGDALVRFYALPTDRPVPGSIQITLGRGDAPLFHALPAEGASDNPAIVPLYAYRHTDGRTRYAPDTTPMGEGWTRSDKPICRAWKSPRPDPVRGTASAVAITR